MMDGPTMASSTAYSVLHRTLETINSCPDLVIIWPDDDSLGHVAARFRASSRPGIMDRCVGAVDGLFIRIHKPMKEHPVRFYSGHKEGFGSTFRQSAMQPTSSQRGACLAQGAPTIGQPGTCQTSNPRWICCLMGDTSSVILPTHPRTVFLRHTRELISAPMKMHSTSSTHNQG
ncbi:unnamed protein product [Discosporangium mesarthrocarpum]